MLIEPSFRKAFGMAVLLHLITFSLLLFESAPQAVAISPQNTQETLAVEKESKPAEVTAIQAVSVDNEALMQAVNKLKQEKEHQLKLEAAKQKAILEQAEMARKKRVLEQQRLAKIKKEEEILALKRKKQLEEEQRHLKQIALEKAQEVKRLEALKVEQEKVRKSHQEEAEKLLQAQNKYAQEKEKQAQEKAAELAEKNRQIAAQKAAQASKMSGEVNKYKSLIISAISRQWILPDNTNDGLSSQFRIRLAPDGAVLEVRLIRSSGDTVLDRSAQTAIHKASPLPVPNDPEVFELFRDISLTVRPENVRG